MKASTLIAFSFFLLPTEIHERYSIMAVVFCLFAALYDRQWAWLAGGLSLTAFWNLWVVVYSSPNPTTDMWMVYLNLVLYAAMVILMGRELRASTRIADRPWPNRGGLEGKSPDPFNAKRSRG